MTTFDRQVIARLFSENCKVSRKSIFGDRDPKPVNFAEDANTMFAGYVGARYRPGNVLLIAINPGGGGDAYIQTSHDRQFYPLLRELRDAEGVSALAPFEAINRTFAEVLPRWNVMGIVSPVLEAADTTLDAVAYLNAVPYRTRNDSTPLVSATINAWHQLTWPVIAALRPGMVVALGKKVGHVLSRFNLGSTKTFVVPRTIGDTYVSEDAKAVLAEIRESVRR